MRLSDCEVSHRVIRGHVVVVLFGERRLDDSELAELAVEYGASHAGQVLPCYASPAGWQLLDKQEPATSADKPPEPAAVDEAQQPPAPSKKLARKGT